MNFNLDKITEILLNYAPKIVGAILTLIIGLWVIKFVTRLIEKKINQSNVDETIRPFLVSMFGGILKVLLLIAVAGMFGVETTSFIAILGALFFAIGMALQGSLAHFANGVLLLIFKPYRIGDLIEVADGRVGTVKDIQLFNTTLLTLDNRHIIVPNSVVTSNVIVNISGQETIGVELTFGIGYDADIDSARQIILEVGKKCKWILDSPKQGVVVAELADSSVNLATRPFCKSEYYWDTYFFMQENVKKEFDKKGIDIPYPNITVHSTGNNP